MLLILLAVTAPAAQPAAPAGHARVVAAAPARPAPPDAPHTADAPAIVPAQQPPDLSWDALLRAGLPGFLASLGSGTVLAVTAWGVKRLVARRGER